MQVFCVCVCLCVRDSRTCLQVCACIHICVKMFVCVCCAMCEQVMETGFSHRDKQSQIPECVMVVRDSPMRLAGCAAAEQDSGVLFKLTHTLRQVRANTQLKC